MLACAQCFSWKPQLDNQHACKETTLVLKEHGTTRYHCIRPIPFRPSLSKLCEDFKNKIPCDKGNNCPYPNTLEEQLVWELSTSFHCTIPDLIEQLKRNSLKCTMQLPSTSCKQCTSRSSGDSGLSINCAELTEMIGGIPLDGDVDEPGEVGTGEDQEEDNDLKTKLERYPDRFKKCIIELEGTNDAMCRTCDPQDPIREIKICGRKNCGRAMSGDTVVVEIITSQALDGNQTVTRGKVVGVTGHGINRKAYTFVCTVDQYRSNLMWPVHCLVPKIRVLDHDVKNKFQNKMAIYRYEKGQLKCMKIVDLNHSCLFVVKYIRWTCGFPCPLGYVCAVIHAGTDIQQEVDILNLTYQVPQHIQMEGEMALVNDINIDTRKRTDMRDLLTVSIHPCGCHNTGDALSIKKIESKTNTKYQVTIHIADVSEQIRKDDKNDQEAKRRMISYYPGGNHAPVHMLPHYLCQNRCSLKAGEDRLALSVTFIIEDDGSCEMETTTIQESVIQNNDSLTYRNAQDIIEGNHSGFNCDDEIRMAVTMLHQVVDKLRESRLGEGLQMYDLDDFLDDDGCPEAHKLTAKFKIMTNKFVEQYLRRNYDGEVPFLYQGKPSDASLMAWNKANRAVVRNSMYFQQFMQEINDIDEIDAHGRTAGNDSHVPIAKATVLEIKKALSNGDEQHARHLFSTEMLHPMHAVAMTDWYKIQESAAYIDSGNLKFKEILKANKHVQFTSPFRRYMDIVTHRLVKAVLRQEASPYTAQEVCLLCEIANKITGRAKQYDQATKLLELTEELRQNALFVPATVRMIDDCGISVCILPVLRMMKPVEIMLRYNDMGVAEKPILEDGKVKLHFNKRIYDADPNTSVTRTKAQSKMQMQLNPTSHICHVREYEWNDLQQTILERPENFSVKAAKVFDPLLKQTRPTQTISDITSEMKGSDPIIDHHADFGLCVERAGVVLVQVSTSVIHGLMSPTISLMNLTPQLDICLEHSKEPVACFVEMATRCTKNTYHSLKEYQDLWKPLISMESVQAAVRDGDPIIIHNVRISMHRSTNAVYGCFVLTKEFCKRRHIKIPKNSTGEDEDKSDYNDYLCLRIPMEQSDQTGIQHQCRKVWMAHAVFSFVSETIVESETTHKVVEAVKAEFRLQRFASPPPDHMLTRMPFSGTVEILPKPLPFR